MLTKDFLNQIAYETISEFASHKDMNTDEIISSVTMFLTKLSSNVIIENAKFDSFPNFATKYIYDDIKDNKIFLKVALTERESLKESEELERELTSKIEARLREYYQKYVDSFPFSEAFRLNLLTLLTTVHWSKVANKLAINIINKEQ